MVVQVFRRPRVCSFNTSFPPMITVLQIAIGMSFVFLLFSLVVSAANELMLAIWGKRAAYLKLGIERLLGTANKASVKAFWNHPLIAGMTKKEGSVPSYLDAKTFAATLLHLAREGDLKMGEGDPATPVHLEPLVEMVKKRDFMG